MKKVLTLKIKPVFLGRKVRYIPHNLNHRLHWRVRHRWNVKWKTNIWNEVLIHKHEVPDLSFNNANVKITFLYCHRLDDDNAHTCCKPLLDGLRYSGVIIDDDPSHISLTVETIKVKHVIEQGVVIEVSQRDV